MFASRNIVQLGVLLGGVAMPFVAYAQTPTPQPAASEAAPSVSAGGEASTTLADIVVTATRRETRLQTTASAVTAVTAVEMQTRGITDMQSLALGTPGMSFGSTTMAQAHIAVRGIGSDTASLGQDPRVAYYQDGVYIGRPTSQLGGVFDLERIEVLKGPQGALYGRNATGGAVNVISARPTEQLNGYVRASYGNFNAVNFEGAAGQAIAPGLSARVAVHYDGHDGYGKNVISGGDVDDKSLAGARVSVLWEPALTLSFLTIGDYSYERDHAYGLHYIGPGNPSVPVLGLKLGGVALAGSHDVASDVAPLAFLRSGGVNETIKLTLGPVQVQSITAYRESTNEIRSDFDGTSLPIFYEHNHELADQVSQEFIASGSVDRLDWLTGILYFHEGLSLATVGPISRAAVGGPLNQIQQGLATGGKLKTDAVAPYFDIAYHLTDQLTLRASGRYTYERKAINDVFQFDFVRPYSPSNPVVSSSPFPRSANVHYDNFAPSATLEWKATPHIFTYVKYSQGFKSGNFNISVNQPPFAPETIDSYEGGIKTTFSVAHALLNLTAFHYDYKNLQVSEVRGTTAVIENAASATITGVEAVGSVEPIRGLTLEGSGTYLDSEYKNFFSTNPVFASLGNQNLSGNQLTQAPKWSLNGSVQQRWVLDRGSLTARGEVAFTSLVYFTPFNEAALKQDGYTLGHASLRYASNDHWSVEAFIRNIGNRTAVAQSVAASGLFGFPVIGTLIPPRTYGVRVGYTF